MSTETRGRLLNEAEAVIADRVKEQYTVTTGPVISWDGEFDSDGSAQISDGDEYTFVLDDGLKGDIIVSRVQHPGGHVWFQGNGAPPS